MNLIESPLRVQARLNEIDRQLFSSRFGVNALKWLAAPVVVVFVAYLSYFLYERDIGVTENVVVGLGGLVSSLIAGVSGYRALQRHIDELEEERAELQPPQSPSRVKRGGRTLFGRWNR